jgi:hypothetical protein
MDKLTYTWVVTLTNKQTKVATVRTHGGLIMNDIQHPVGLILWCALLEEYSILCGFIEGGVDGDVHLSTVRDEFVCFIIGYCSAVHRSRFQHSDVPSYIRDITVGQYSSSVRTQQ